MASEKSVNIGSGNGMFPDGTKPESTLFTHESIHQEYVIIILMVCSQLYIWKISNTDCGISGGK